jgi:hypothetical protein
MVKYILGFTLLWILPAAADISHCSHNGGPEYVCHICYRGAWWNVTEYECSVAMERRQARRWAIQVRKRYHHD